jgi:putative redox protein
VAHAKVTWFGGRQFVGVDSSKHSVVMSAQDEANATGMKPSDLLLVALAGCTAVDVVEILEKKRQDLRGLEINIRGEQDKDPPWTFRRIEIEYVVSGRGLKEKAVADAIQISEEKYCSVSATVRGVAEITTSYRIVEVFSLNTSSPSHTRKP